MKSAKRLRFATARHMAAVSPNDGGNGSSSVIPQLHCAALAVEEANDFEDVINDIS